MSHTALPDALRQFVQAAFCITVTGLLGAACAHFGADRGDGAGETASRSRERAMNQRWQNRPLSQLVAARGEPRLLLNIPGGGNPPGFVAVYGPDPATGCLDAFALLYGADPEIRSYYCR
jgi:hypothetical protein